MEDTAAHVQSTTVLPSFSPTVCAPTRGQTVKMTTSDTKYANT